MITGLKNKLIIISSPSGAGKTTLCKLLIKKMKNINLSISYTSRSKRLNEVNGKDYYFVSKKKFDSETDFVVVFPSSSETSQKLQKTKFGIRNFRRKKLFSSKNEKLGIV